MRIVCDDANDEQFVRDVFAPCLTESETPDAIISVEGETVSFLSGADVEPRTSGSVRHRIEWLLVDYFQSLAEGHLLVHAAAVVRGSNVLVLVAPSGGGKSTLTKEAVRDGWSYLTDDLLLVRKRTLFGLARSVRFKPWLEGKRPAFLADARMLSSSSLAPARVPSWWDAEASCLRQWPCPEEGATVVRVGRGEPQVERLSQLDRAVLLHEAAIVDYSGEYDGSLGSGPTYSLTWQEEPRASYQLLMDEMESQGSGSDRV